MNDATKKRDDLSRRRALGLIAGADAAADASGVDGAGDGAACEVTPEGEIGPYFSDDSDARFNRSNILSNLDGSSTQVGVGLTLTVTVLDVENACAPYANAQVDIWHCNSAGVYSDQASDSTTTETWLRGYQMTDANGQATFVTIIPGWYAGRTTHIHLRVRSTYSTASSTSDGTNTTQLFCTQALDDTLATTGRAVQRRRDEPDEERGRSRLFGRDERRECPGALGRSDERLHRRDHDWSSDYERLTLPSHPLISSGASA